MFKCSYFGRELSQICVGVWLLLPPASCLLKCSLIFAIFSDGVKFFVSFVDLEVRSKSYCGLVDAPLEVIFEHRRLESHFAFDVSSCLHKVL